MMFCSIYRFLLSSALDGDKPLSRALRSHIDKCPDCRAFHESSVEIGSALSRQAARRTDTVGHAEIRRIFQAAAKSSPVVVVQRNYAKYYAAAAAVIIVACLGLMIHHGNRSAGHGDWEPVGRAINDVKVAGQTFAGPLASEPSQAAIPFAMERPLASELDGLNDRTRSAVRFLIDCTPYKLPKSGRGSIN